jgi:L-threonylcarbamoyladenylate synthase
MRPTTTEEIELENAIAALKAGGVILYPTDTIWGIGCDATNDAAVEKIFQIKKRAENKSMIVLLDTENKLLRYVKEIPEQAWNLIEFSTRPLTIIYNNGLNLSKKIIAEDGSVAIRITKDSFCRKLIHKYGKPLVSTSANISGDPSPDCFADINAEVLNGVDYVVNLRQNEKSQVSPSVILKLDMNGQIRIIRK